MNYAFSLLTRRVAFPASGWVRSTEVVRSPQGLAHPHFHVLLTLSEYRHIRDWVQDWRDCLGIRYTPICHIQKADIDSFQECFKYACKPSDMQADASWLNEYISQINSLKFLQSGGILREYFREDAEERSNLININQTRNLQNSASQQVLNFEFQSEEWFNCQLQFYSLVQS